MSSQTSSQISSNSIDISYSDLNKVNSKIVYNQLSEYTRIARYAQHNSRKKRRETWEEQVNRVYKMHRVKFSNLIDNEAFNNSLDFVKKMMLEKRVLGSQRALQFGGPSILNKNTRIYNCAATYIDRAIVFQESIFTLLCGVGMGFSVQKHHIDKLPSIKRPSGDKKIFEIPDSIEGWADSVGILLSSYFTSNQPFPEYTNKDVVFDARLVRPKGSPISHMGGQAPGPSGLISSLEKIRELLTKCCENGQTRLRPIDAYDIIMHESDAVLSGGVRRSATLCLFSLDDEEMIKAKTGDWYIKNPQRARSNNSALLLRDSVSEKKYTDLMEYVRQFGEPGLIFSDNTEMLYNPCVEVGLYGYDEKGNSGFQMCNLSEINMTIINTPEEFYESCRAASIIGTLQAGYTDMGYLGKITQNIIEREALIGVSMTGMMDSPALSFDPKVLTKGAEIIKETNKEIATLIGINQAARTTCVKPAGSTSCILNTSSGIHPCHSKRYFRRVQSNKLETPLEFFKKYNPNSVTQSVWSANNTDDVVTFLCKSKQGAITKNDVSAVGLLDKVKLVQEFWVNAGRNIDICVKPWLSHNVSNTITVGKDEWLKVADYIFQNKTYFAGISLLGESGDMDYPQAPFQAVYTHEEIAQKYGAGSIFASGLIVHAHEAFNNDLYNACACLLGHGEKLSTPSFNIDDSKESFMQSDQMYKKTRWIAQAKKFAKRHFNDDEVKMTHCLKAVDGWKIWCDLKRTYKNVPWEEFKETSDNTKRKDYQACSGNGCEVISF